MLLLANIGEVNFAFDVHSKVMIHQLNKYRHENKYKYLIKVHIVDELEKISLKVKTESPFYRLYQGDGCLIQEQKNEGNNVFALTKYFVDSADIYILKKYFNSQSEYLMCEYAFLYYIFQEKNGILIHSSSFAYLNNGYLLVASSGTGKSTHARLWREKEKVITINDDKNLIIDDGKDLLIYPNPFSGKSLIDNDLIVKLKGIIILSRGETNHAERISVKNGFISLLPHILNTSFMLKKETWDLVTNKIISLVKFYSLKCNISYEAVDCLKSLLEEDNEI